MNEECTCGHVRDEHNRGVACVIEGCPCFQFEAYSDTIDEKG